MPDNYDVTVDYIQTPGQTLLPGANTGVQATFEPGREYTISADITMNDVPSFGSTDHCQSGLSGGALVEMVVDSASGSSSTQKCVTGGEGDTTTISLDYQAPSGEGVTDTISVDFYGAQSGDQLAERTVFQIQTQEQSVEDTEGYEVFVDRIRTPVGDLTPGDDVTTTRTLQPGETFVVEAPVEMGNIPGPLHEDRCGAVQGGAEIMLEVGSITGVRESTTECVVGPSGTVTTILTQFRAPSSGGITDQIFVNVFGASSKDPIVPTTYFEIQTEDEPDIGDGVVGEFDPLTLEPRCSISADNVTEGEVVDVTISFAEDLPGGSDARDIQVSLLVDGDVVAEGVSRATRNLVPETTFTVELPPGDHSIGYELADLGQ